MQFKIPGFYISCILLMACNNFDSKPDADFLASNIDTSTKASEDFFKYANGGWIKNNPIPASERSWGVGDMVEEEIFSRLRKINESALKENTNEGSVSQKIADFWYSGMDSSSIEKKGLQPLQEDLDKINRITGSKDIINLAAEFHKKGIDILFNDYVAQDEKNSDVMAFQLSQGGIGMPNRDYYFNTDKQTVEVRNAYHQYLIKTFIQLGNDSSSASQKASAVFELETKLASSSRKLADLRDPYKNYNKMSVASLNKLSQHLLWPQYFQKAGIVKLDSVIVGQPEFYIRLNHEIESTAVDVWKDYLRINLVRFSAPFLDKITYSNYFEYVKSLSGAREPRPRWKRVIAAEENAMGEALGQLFVNEYFNEKTKERYMSMVEAVRDAFKQRIMQLDWMSDSTKQKALRKLSHISQKIGYPDKWKDFSALKIDRGPYVLNVQRANEWWYQYEINKLGKPVDKTEWGMSPQTYNAYYNPSNNEIVLPAGIFVVPGKKDEDLDDAFVFGYAAASTIGHELTHGFDDEGRQFDEKGNLKNWWQADDEFQFKLRAKKIIQQYGEFNPIDTLHINGDATQGENIADLGGVLLGLDAFKKSVSYKEGKTIGGFTPIQRYFLGYAYAWMYQENKESLASGLMSDVHSPPKERVNGPLVNIPDFYKAFGVKKGDKMYREDSLRVKIW